MRPISNPRKFTPFGIFMHQYCNPSETGLIVMNQDYIVHNYKTRTVMLFEEKIGDEAVTFAQSEILKQLDDIYRNGCGPARVNYWGIYVLRLPAGCTHVGPGIRLNGVSISVEQLVQHINFEAQAAPPINPTMLGQTTLDAVERREMINGRA